MFGRTVVLLCVTAFVHSATVPNIDELLEQLKLGDVGFQRSQITDRENEIDSNSNICETEICAMDSITMLSHMDQMVDPCENFYEFACGKFVHETILSNDRIAESAFSKLNDKLNEQMEAALSEEIQPNESHAFQLAKKFTHMCVDEKGNEEKGVQPLLEVLEKLGGWPVIKGVKWNGNNWNWLSAQKEMFHDGLNSDLILEFRIGPHYHNSTERVIYVSVFSLFWANGHIKLSLMLEFMGYRSIDRLSDCRTIFY